MRKAIKVLLFILLSFVVPYAVMQIGGNFTVKSYGNVLCYIGMAHVIIGLFSWSSGISVGDRTSKGNLYSSNLYDDLRSTNDNPIAMRFSFVIPAVFEIIGAGTIYFGYMLTKL